VPANGVVREAEAEAEDSNAAVTDIEFRRPAGSTRTRYYARLPHECTDAIFPQPQERQSDPRVVMTGAAEEEPVQDNAVHVTEDTPHQPPRNPPRELRHLLLSTDFRVRVSNSTNRSVTHGEFQKSC
jgi:hypothetical protein